jgi:hypothetical protein
MSDSNKNILTYNASVAQIEQNYYAPISTITSSGNIVETTYAFMSKVDPWPTDPLTNVEDPAQPTQDQKYIKSVFKNMFYLKRLTSNNIRSVAQRIDWQTGTTYQYYQDNIDIFATDTNGYLINNFYVRNRYNQVFKCLWNNNGAPTTVEPFFQPGNYGTNNIFVGSDGYKWKFMFVITGGDQVNFLDASWIPVPIVHTSPSPTYTPTSSGYNFQSLTNAGSGDVEVVNVTNGGVGYTAQNTTVKIVGDGFGASANAVISGGVITDITVSNPGYNYTYANVVITTTDTLSNTATAVAPVSPVGGHGFDPISELGCFRTMYNIEFSGSEGSSLPTDINYRQIGLLVNPTSQDSYPLPATDMEFNTSIKVTVAPGIGTYINDEIVTQVDLNANSPTYNQVVFSGTVLSFNSATNLVELINITVGTTPVLNSSLTGSISKNARTVLNFSTSTFIPFSGYLTYIENRSGVQRSADGIEQFKFVLGY